eukprot:GGOE01042291.1.p1 GENE.GGOE01042291.1~~GGOE01042291.1.p1  ORF type:complete len:397 (-),score=77.32 GGOE01042291.1:222-1343(-)
MSGSPAMPNLTPPSAVVGSSSLDVSAAADLPGRLRQWANVDTQLCPEFPSAAPQFLGCYLDRDSPVYAPFLYAAQNPGSQHRVEFLRAVDAVVKVPPGLAGHIAELVQAMHTCSLIVDDVMDESPLRRGRPAAHTVYGAPHAMGAAYSALFQVLLSTAIHCGDAALLAVTEESARMHHCNTLELHWRATRQCPTEEQYFSMVDGKTGSGFRVVVRLLLAVAERTSPLPAAVQRQLLLFADELGRFFQVRDDYLDLVDELYSHKKGGVGSDLIAGNWSYPVVWCVGRRPDLLPAFTDAFSSPAPPSRAVVDHLLSLLHESGSLEHTRCTLQGMADKLAHLATQLQSDHHDASGLLSYTQALVSATSGLTLAPPM